MEQNSERSTPKLPTVISGKTQYDRPLFTFPASFFFPYLIEGFVVPRPGSQAACAAAPSKPSTAHKSKQPSPGPPVGGRSSSIARSNAVEASAYTPSRQFIVEADTTTPATVAACQVAAKHDHDVPFVPITSSSSAGFASLEYLHEQGSGKSSGRTTPVDSILILLINSHCFWN